MATTQYIGARYVPLFADPAEWNSTRTYEPLTIVMNEGNSYTSKQYVPKGIDISNEKFWALTGNYNAQVEAYRKDVIREQTRAEAAEQTLTIDIAELDKRTTYRFDTLKELLNANIEVGCICYVSGRLTKNIGGGFYRISTNETANGYDKVNCSNGNVAVFIPLNSVTPEQLEQENTTDYAPLIKYTIDYAKANSINMLACGVYETATPIVFEAGTSGYNVNIAGSIVYSGTDYAIKIKNINSSYYFQTISAANGSGIAFDQRDNSYDDLVANHYLELGKINAKDNGVGFIAGNHGVLDIEVQCNISIHAANCYYSHGGNGTSEKKSYASEFHIHGGRLYGSNYAINIEVGSGYECTGHSYCNFSAEGSDKLINLDAGTGTINTMHLENVRIAEIGYKGMIKATGNVRECDFYFNHMFMLTWFENNMTSDSSRGCYVHAPISMQGGSYTGFNCAYFAGNDKLILSDMNMMFESGISEGYQWSKDGTTRPLSMIHASGTFDLSQFPNFTNNGIPFYIHNEKNIKITDGSTTVFDGTTADMGMYALIKTNNSTRVLKMI